MKSILLKDYLEQRLYFIILVAVAVVSMLLAAYFKQLDSGVAMVILFVLQGPLFVYLVANHQISSEISNNTMPFLNSLPISQTRLWLAKLVFVTVYSALLYALYIIIGAISGIETSELYKLFVTYPALGIGIPALAISFGFFTTMLPRGFAMLAFLIVSALGAPVFLNIYSLMALNFNLLFSMLTVLFLACSAAVFLKNRNMTANWRGVYALALLLAGSAIFTGAWSTIDMAADRQISQPPPESTFMIPLDGGNSVLWATVTPTPSWDVIKMRHEDYVLRKGYPSATSLDGLVRIRKEGTPRLILNNLQTGTKKQVGPRHSNMFAMFSSRGSVLFNNEFFMASRSKITAGFYRGQESVVYDKHGNHVVTLPRDLDKEPYDGEYGRQFKLIDDQRFIYLEEIKNGNSVITEFTLYEKGKGSRVVFTSQEDFAFYDYIVMPAREPGKPASVFIQGFSEREPEKQLLISVPDGKRYVLPAPKFSTYVMAGSEFFVVAHNSNRGSKDYQRALTAVYLDGRTVALDWIATDTELLTITPAGKILAMNNDKETMEWYRPRRESLVEIDVTGPNSRELIKFTPTVSVWLSINPERSKALMFTSTRSQKPAQYSWQTIDLKTGDVKQLEIPTVKEGWPTFDPIAVGGDIFMAHINGRLYQIDVEKQTATVKASIRDFENSFDKGGL